MCFEWTCGRSAGDGLHHGRFDFKISAVIEEAPEGTEHFGALNEDFAGIEVGEVAVAELAVHQGEPEPALIGEGHSLELRLVDPRLRKIGLLRMGREIRRVRVDHRVSEPRARRLRPSDASRNS